MNTTEVFAERFKKLRTDKGLSLQKIGQDLNVTAQSLSLYEKGQRTINIDLLKRIAEYFNVSSDYLIGLSDVASVDTDLKSVCDYTGLNDASIKDLVFIKENTCNAVRQTTDDIISNGLLFDLANAFAIIKAESGTYIKMQKEQKLSEEELEQHNFKLDTYRYRMIKALDKCIAEYDLREQVKNNGNDNKKDE